MTVPTIVIGTIGRPHGIGGAVHSRASGPTLETLAVGDVVEVRPRTGEPRRLTVATRAGMSDQPILHFVGIDSRPAASLLTGAAIAVEADRIRELVDPDVFFVRDLIGCAVSLGDDALGTVTEVHSGPANDALEVAAADGAVLVPFTGDAVRELDLPGRRIVLRPDLFG